MAYAYRYNLPEGLSNDQHNKLKKLSLNTARGASVVNTGRFRRGWVSNITNNVLTVQNNVYYAIYLELGTKYSRRHRFKVRDALNRIGFESMKPVILIEEQRPEGLADTQSGNQSTGVQNSGSLVNVEGANAIDSLDDLLLPTDDPIDILIKPVPQFNDDTRPSFPVKINTLQEAVSTYKKTYGLEGPITFDSLLTQYKKLIPTKLPVIDLFNKAALVALMTTQLLQRKEEINERETDIQGEVQ